MINRLINNIHRSPTAFHAGAKAAQILEENGFIRLSEKDAWKIEKGGKYYVVRNTSSVLAFTVGKDFRYNIIAAHTDSPCFKIKGNADMKEGGLNKLNVEAYGMPIFWSWLDRELKVGGRAFYPSKNGVEERLIESDYTVVIPDIAVHLNREANSGYKFNPQVDMCPISGFGENHLKQLLDGAISHELYLVSSQKGFLAGKNNELICSPRLDNLDGVFGGLEAFTKSKGKGINVLALFDCEEVGSMTRHGASSMFLTDTLNRIACSLGKSDDEFRRAQASSLLISLDNAHAVHPNHPQLSDPSNPTVLGGGIAVKHQAGFNYATDGFSEACIKKLFIDCGAKFQDFFVRSDLRGGATLGPLISKNLSIATVDIGLPQLAMHSAMEVIAAADYEQMVKGLTAFYENL